MCVRACVCSPECSFRVQEKDLQMTILVLQLIYSLLVNKIIFTFLNSLGFQIQVSNHIILFISLANFTIKKTLKIFSSICKFN